MIPFLKLIRLPNLILIALLQFFLRTYFVQPIMNSFSLNLILTDVQFYLLMFMTSLIAAAGYIINDYFDLKIDYVNRSGDDIIIGNTIKRRVAMLLHIVLSSIGVLIGCYLAYTLHIWVIALVPILVVGLLWFYSTDYKRQFLIGNLVLSFLSIFPILILILFEPAIFQAYYSFEYRAVAVLIFKVLLYFSFIAFGVSLVYAILKDLHDLPGDEAVNAKTLPILAGETTAKLTISFISVAIIFALFYRKFNPSSSSNARHLISRSPGIISFLVASNYRAAKLYSIDSVTYMRNFWSSMGCSIRPNRLGWRSFIRFCGSFLSILRISSFWFCESFFFSSCFFSKMNTETSILPRSFFFAR